MTTLQMLIRCNEEIATIEAEAFNIFEALYQHTFGKRGESWQWTSNTNRNKIPIGYYYQSFPKTQDRKINFFNIYQF